MQSMYMGAGRNSQKASAAKRVFCAGHALHRGFCAVALISA